MSTQEHEAFSGVSGTGQHKTASIFIMKRNYIIYNLIKTQFLSKMGFKMIKTKNERTIKNISEPKADYMGKEER